jgi:RNA polymerase sigma-70 factor (ECF subfamily)
MVRPGVPKEVRGPVAVANMFSGRAQAAQLALLDGAAGAVWAPGGQPRVALGFTLARGKIVAIDMIGDAERLGQLDIKVLDD